MAHLSGRRASYVQCLPDAFAKSAVFHKKFCAYVFYATNCESTASNN